MWRTITPGHERINKFAHNQGRSLTQHMLRLDSMFVAGNSRLKLSAARAVLLDPVRLNKTQRKARVVMANTTHPSKQQVRAYLQRRSHDPKPPPTPDEIRRELGWHLVTLALIRS